MIVNGIEVRPNYAFCEVIMPFLPEFAANDLKRYVFAMQSGD